MDNAPNRRQALEGETYDGVFVRLKYTVARKLYRCPGCGTSVEIGSAHTLVQYPTAEPPWHQHWHRECAVTAFVRQLKTSRVVQAN
jgi:hypothetical protein